MKAAVLKRFGEPLAIETVPDPSIGTGEVLVEIVATNVLPYSADVISNARRYPIALPMILGTGAIGRVLAIGPDATKLKVGDWVVCDNTVRGRDDAINPDIVLQGWSARGDGGRTLQRFYHDGPWAERMMTATGSVAPIGDIIAGEAAAWSIMLLTLVPYGGLLAVDLRAGETVVVSGATGNFGSAGVAVALAMGAGRVVAPGRNDRVLAELAQRLGPRVLPVRLTGDEEADRAAIQTAADGPIDVVLDLLPPSAPAAAARTAAMAVRQFGRIALMGGVGMLGGDDLALPYPWLMRNCITIKGQWMYPASALAGMVRLIRSGLLDLRCWDLKTFPLSAANEAVAAAADWGGPFRAVVMEPRSQPRTRAPDASDRPAIYPSSTGR